MAVRKMTTLDFIKKGELQNALMHLVSGSPSTPAEGQFWYDTAAHAPKYFDGTTNQPFGGTPGDATTGAKGIIQLSGDLAGTAASPQIAAGAIVDADVNSGAAIALSKLATDPLARANHTGTQLAATISNLATVVKAYRHDEFAAPTANVSWNNQKITNLLDPTAAQDAATKAYVDSVVSGLDPKQSVRVATTAAGTLATSFANGQTVDGVVLATGDRILIKDQVAPAENGIYVVAASGAPTRATDADSWTELVSAFTFVEEGTANADNGFTCTVNTGGTLNTTAVTWTQFSGAGQITAGSGLSKTGNTLDVNVDGATIEINADTLRVKAAGINLASHVTGTLPVANGGTGQTTAKAARETGLGATGFYNSETHTSGTTISIAQATHLLRAGKGLVVKTYDVSTGDERTDNVTINSSGDVTITFSSSQSANSIGVTIVG